MKEKIFCDCDCIHNDAVNKVKSKMPDMEDLVKLAGLYKVFADSTRIRILCALRESELCVCDLAVSLNMTKSAISHQLNGLRLSGLVKYDKRGKVVYYSLADSHISDIFRIGFEHINE